MEQAYKCRLIASAMTCVERVTKTFGSCPVGLALVEAFYCLDDQWLTPQQVAERAGISDDTARRRLDELHHIGRIEAKDLGSNRRSYRVIERHAEATIRAIHDACSV